MLQLCDNVVQKSMPPEKEKKLWQPNRTKQNHGSVWLPGAEPGGGFTLVIFGLDQTQKSEPNKPSLKVINNTFAFPAISSQQVRDDKYPDQCAEFFRPVLGAGPQSVTRGKHYQ